MFFIFQEFRGLRNSLQQFAGDSSVQVTSRSSGSLDGSSIGGSFFSRYAKSGTPFDFYPEIGALCKEENILDVTVSMFLSKYNVDCVLYLEKSTHILLGDANLLVVLSYNVQDVLIVTRSHGSLWKDHSGGKASACITQWRFTLINACCIYLNVCWNLILVIAYFPLQKQY